MPSLLVAARWSSCALAVAAASACTSETSGEDGGELGGAGGDSGTSVTSATGGPSGGTTTTSTGSTSTGTGGGQGGVPVVIAQGHVGRTMLSCDDGVTWVSDRSDDPDARCDQGLDCDHHPGSGTGLVVSNGYAIMSSGWGTPGRVRRSADGVTWDVVLELDFPFASIAVGDGVLLGATPRPWSSSDDGATWAQVPEVYLAPPLRGSIHIPNRFVLTSEGAGLSAWTTDDFGETFQERGALPEGCIAFVLATGNGAILMPHVSGGVCRSTDGAQSWSVVDVGGAGGMATLVFDGSRFVLYGDGALYASADGAAWTTTPVDLPFATWNAQVGVNTETGTLVAASSSYEDQRFFRSADGLTWTESMSAPTGHPIRRFVAARLASPVCGM